MPTTKRKSAPRRKNAPKRKNAARKRNPPLSKSLSNFTGRVGITTDGRLNIQGVQMKTNPSWARRKNESVEMGFYDKQGRFHPIRASDDYDPEAAGEYRKKRRKKTKARKKK